MSEQEKVLCVPSRLIKELGIAEGFSLGFNNPLFVSLQSGNYQFVERDLAEEDFSLKQLIPYVVVICNGAVLRYVRGKLEGETRLHGKRSIGVGGHINSHDSSNGVGGILRTFVQGILREMQEELCLPEVDLPSHPVAYINDNTTDVGKVHLGVVYALHLPSGCLDLRQTALNRPEWIPIRFPIGDLEEYEMWSQHCLLNLDLITSRYAQLGSGKTVPVRILRQSIYPGFYECTNAHHHEPLVISRSQFRI